MTMCRPTVVELRCDSRREQLLGAHFEKRRQRASDPKGVELGGGRPTVGHWAPTLLEDSRASS